MKRSRHVLPGVLLALCVILSFSSCRRTANADVSTLYIDEDGYIEQLIVEPRDDEDDFSQEELEDYITETLASYTEQTGTEENSGEEGQTTETGAEDEEPISLISCSVETGTVRIRLRYVSWRDYAAYNQVPCFIGTVEQAQSEGYSFDAGFADRDGENVSTEEVLQSPGERRVVILQESAAVEIPGTILYHTENVTVTGTRAAVVGEADASSGQDAFASSVNSIAESFIHLLDAPAYIIYM